MNKAWVFSDNISTEEIIRGPNVWRQDYHKYLFDIARKDLNQAIQLDSTRGDFFVAGKNFGIGSSRQRAVEGLILIGIKAVIAKSFATVYGDTAVSVGLPIYKFSRDENVDIDDGDILELDEDNLLVIDQTKHKHYRLMPVSNVIREVLKGGGIIRYINEHGDWPQLKK